MKKCGTVLLLSYSRIEKKVRNLYDGFLPSEQQNVLMQEPGTLSGVH